MQLRTYIQNVTVFQKNLFEFLEELESYKPNWVKLGEAAGRIEFYKKEFSYITPPKEVVHHYAAVTEYLKKLENACLGNGETDIELTIAGLVAGLQSGGSPEDIAERIHIALQNEYDLSRVHSVLRGLLDANQQICKSYLKHQKLINANKYKAPKPKRR